MCACVDVCTVPAPVPSSRKFLTIVLSVVRFGHPMSAMRWAGALFVFGGLSVEAVHKYQKQKEHAAAKAKKA